MTEAAANIMLLSRRKFLVAAFLQFSMSMLSSSAFVLPNGKAATWPSSSSMASSVTTDFPIPRSPTREPPMRSSRHAANAMRDTAKLGTLTVPSLGLGTISWSSNSLMRLENEELEDVVSVAYQSNAAFLDTAERYGSHLKTAFGLGYGETERLSALFLRRAKESTGRRVRAPVVATKFTPTPWRTTVQSVVDACQESRKNLGLADGEPIDLYQIHMPDIVNPFKTPAKDEIYWEGLAECYHRGLVSNVGVCNYGPTMLRKCHAALAKRGVPLASNQIAFSLLGRHAGAQETVDACRDLGVQVLAYYPFAMGLLTGKYSSTSPLDPSLRSIQKSSLELRDLERYAQGDGVTVPKGGIGPLLRVMEQIATRRRKTVAQVALNYVLCKGAIPIPGARSVAQLQDNLGALGWRMTKDEVASLELQADMLGFGFDGAGFKRTSEKFVGYGVEKFELN